MDWMVVGVFVEWLTGVSGVGVELVRALFVHRTFPPLTRSIQNHWWTAHRVEIRQALVCPAPLDGRSVP